MVIKKQKQWMKHNPCFILITLLILLGALQGQLFARENDSDIVIGTTTQIKSKILGESRTIFINLPKGYETSARKYPVLYEFDLEGVLFHYSTGIVRLLAFQRLISPMIVVSVTVDGNRDLTPTQTAGYGPTSGGADNFIKFLKEELVPYIDKNYRTTSFRIIWDHSIGATLCIYALLSAPEVFNAYLASSPWLIYDGESKFLLKNAEKFLKKRTTQKNFLYLTVGNEPNLLPSIEAFNNILKKTAPKGLKWEYRVLKDENHNTMMGRCLQEGLQALRDYM